ncbi:unnamed protein product [Cuscuta epithymum]|uniref:Uncharacterized protein n=1 Tax=Cuscuta epithymum TaxID=186058 RepID=A0AAV0ELB5_9ASTE|nr:unnamed protein product [Cuscuta epithymum]
MWAHEIERSKIDLAMAAYTLTRSRVISLVIIFAIASTSTAGARERVRLDENDRRILKAMMDRCVEIFLYPFSPPPHRFVNADEASLVPGLTMYNCASLFNNLRNIAGRYTPEILQMLYEIPFFEFPRFWFGSGTDVPPAIDYSKPGVFRGGPFLYGKDNRTEIPAEDYQALKAVMDSCVGQFLHHWEEKDDEESRDNLKFCDDYFYYLSSFYENNDRLTPEFVRVMKNFVDKYRALSREEQLLHRCLIVERHRPQYCLDLIQFITPEFTEENMHTSLLQDVFAGLHQR